MDQIFSTHKKIKGYANKVSKQIEDVYSQHPEPIVLLGVLNGALPFLHEVSMRINKVPVAIDTVRCQSYTGIFSRGKVKITKKPDLDLSNKTVIIVEDIVDSGETMKALITYLTKKIRQYYNRDMFII